jgi:hypothetical protein
MAVGASRFLLGLINITAFYTASYYQSVSTTFSRAASMLVGLVAPEHVAANDYFLRSQNVPASFRSNPRSGA